MGIRETITGKFLASIYFLRKLKLLRRRKPH
jgi:hypothetical protein